MGGLRSRDSSYSYSREKNTGEVVLHPVFDTTLMQYRVEPRVGFEVASLELHCEGCTRDVEIIVRD